MSGIGWVAVTGTTGARGKAEGRPHLLRVNVAASSPEDLRRACSDQDINHIEIYADFSKVTVDEKKRLLEPWCTLDLSVLESASHLESFAFMSNVRSPGLPDLRLDLSPLARHDDLREIVIKGYVEDADLSPLRDCRELRVLSVQMAKTRSGFAFLSDLRHLSRLELEVTWPKVDFSPAGDCDQLTDVTLSCLQYVDASALGSCPKLQTLHIGPLDSIHDSDWSDSVWVRWGGRRYTFGVTLPSSKSLRSLDLSENYLTYPYWSDPDAAETIGESEQLDLSQLHVCSRLEHINLQMNGLHFIDLRQMTDIERVNNMPLPVVDLRNNHLVAVNTEVYAPFEERILLDDGVVATKDDQQVIREFWNAAEENRLPYPLDQEFISWLELHWIKGDDTPL